MEPYIADNKAGSLYNIITKIDATSGRWPTQSINGLCKIAQQCLESKVHDRATIEKVCVVTEWIWLYVVSNCFRFILYYKRTGVKHHCCT